MPGYTFVTVDHPLGNNGTVPNGINATGQIVGTYVGANGNHSFIYSDGTFVTLPDDPAAVPGFSLATGLNASDQIVGEYLDANLLADHGFLYSNGQFTTIDDPLAGNGSGQGTVALGINDAGQIVGFYLTSTNVIHGFVYSHGVFTPINDPSAGGGASQGTEATGINNTGQIVGSYIDASGNEHGFLFSNGTYTTIDDPGANGGTGLSGINDLGQIAGSGAINSQFDGFVYNGGVFTTVDDPLGNPTGNAVDGINDSGQLVGTYGTGSGNSSITNGYRADVALPAGLTPAFDPGWRVLGTGDFNGDGMGDLAWQRQSDGLVEIQLLSGTGTIGGGAIPNSPFNSAWTVVALGDFNGDGLPDLVYQRADGLTELQFLNGNNAVGGGAIVNNPFGAGWTVLDAADFNGDLHSDLIWQRNSDGLAEIQFLNGTTPVGGGAIPNNPFGLGWSVAATGDFNGDGHQDIVWQRAADGLVEIQFLNGVTPLGGGAIPNNPFGAGWSVVGAGDFNGDGKTDLVWQRASDGLIELSYMNGTSIIGGGAVANNPFGAGWSVVGVNDFNGDGRPDLVLRHASDGLTVDLTLNGPTATSSGTLAFG
jgi:probable HAF family extracellular repeat protein